MAGEQEEKLFCAICQNSNYKIHKLHSRLDIRKYSFTQRIVNDWINQIKGHIDKYLRNRAEDYTSQRLTPFLVNSSTM